MCGDVTFDYTVEDGDGGSDTGTVTIDLTCVNEQPVANDDTLNGTEDTDVTATEGDLTGNDTDVDGDSLTSRPSATRRAARSAEQRRSRSPRRDACDPTEFGFDYDISDGLDGTDTGHVVVNISCENDNPAAVDDDASGTEDQDVTITVRPGRRRHRRRGRQPDGDRRLERRGRHVRSTAARSPSSPTADLCGDDAASFDYTVEDGNGGTATGTVTIDLTCENDAPVAGDDTVDVTEDTATDVTDTLLDNDTDVDTGDTLTIDVWTCPEGSVELDGGVVTFTRRPTCAAPARAASTTTLSDGTTTDTGHVTVDITCVNDDPTPMTTTPRAPRTPTS